MTKPQEPKKSNKKAKKQRLDLLVLELELFESRKEAQTAIMDGWVLVDGEKCTKVGTNIDTEANITLKTGFKKKAYVSRGGLKLEKALKEFKVDVSGLVCVDLGASTGGFTDCLLKHGAGIVYAVDVGYGQLDWSLRNDERVILKERQNARYLTPEILYGEAAVEANSKDPEDFDTFARFACVDCSFISLGKIIPVIPPVLASKNIKAICLVKPQFEAGREEAKKGVVKDPKVHERVLESVAGFVENSGLKLTAATFSPVKGPSGKIEYLILLEDEGIHLTSFGELVESAFTGLK